MWPLGNYAKNSSTPTALAAARPSSRGLTEDVAVINGAFSDYLLSRGFAEFTITHYRRNLAYLATWLRTHRWRGRLTRLTRLTFDRLLHDLEVERTHKTVLGYRKPLRHWLRFHGRLARARRPSLWQPWLDDYLEFLRIHRGVGQSTEEHTQRDVSAYLRWQFGRKPVDWMAVRPQDFLKLAERFIRGVKPNYAAARLNCVRGFLAFVHLRGACAPDLAAAIPKIAQFHQQKKPVTLSERQCHQLLASFTRSKPEGKRDYAITRCMLDLGLRGAEVIALRLRDIDWKHHRLQVPPVKTGRGRQLPIPPAGLRSTPRLCPASASRFDQTRQSVCAASAARRPTPRSLSSQGHGLPSLSSVRFSSILEWRAPLATYLRDSSASTGALT